MIKKITLAFMAALSLFALSGCDNNKYDIGITGIQEIRRLCLDDMVFYSIRNSTSGGVTMTQVFTEGPNGLKPLQCKVDN